MEDSGVFVLMLVLAIAASASCASCTTNEVIKNDCEKMESFRIGTHVYECKERK